MKGKSKKYYIPRRSAKNKLLKKDELKMFFQLWDTYPHRCEVTGQKIEFFSPSSFHHILTKQAYPGFYLEPSNILICHPEVHRDIHDHPGRDAYSFLVTMREILKQKYHLRNQKT